MKCVVSTLILTFALLGVCENAMPESSVTVGVEAVAVAVARPPHGRSRFKETASELSPAFRTRIRHWSRQRFPSRHLCLDKVRHFGDVNAGHGGYSVIPMRGGGFLATVDGDETSAAAFSLTGSFPEDEESHLRILLERDAKAVAKARKDKRTLGFRGRRAMAEALSYSIPDNAIIPDATFTILVEPLLKTEWSQTGQGQAREPICGGFGARCYNYYTPEAVPSREATYQTFTHYACGCVATAFAQVMKYWRYPDKMPEIDRSDDATDSDEYPFDCYRWDDMPDKPERGVTELNCMAIGRLVRDLGIVGNANYGPTGTGMSTANVANCLAETFSYVGASCNSVTIESFADVQDSWWIRAALTGSLIAGKPIVVAIRDIDDNGGHSVVFDGYGILGTGQDETVCYHVNFGWAGKSNCWYIPPSLDYFEVIYRLCCNLDPHVKKSIVAGRVLSESSGTPIPNAHLCLSRQDGSTIAEADADPIGQFSFEVDDGSYSVSASCQDKSVSKTVSVVFNDITLMNADASMKLDVEVTPKPSLSLVTHDDGTVTVSAFHEHEAADIHYAIGGAAATARSQRYDGPFDLVMAETTTVTAVAWEPGRAVSELAVLEVPFSVSTDNDAFANPRVLVGTNGSVRISNVAATREANEPRHSPVGKRGGASVWAAFKVPVDGDFTFRASGKCAADGEKALDTQLAVYVGERIENLARVAANDDERRCYDEISSRVAFAARSGETYWIAVDTLDGGEGTIDLAWETGRDDSVETDEFAFYADCKPAQWSVPVHATAPWRILYCPPWIRTDRDSGSDGDVLGLSVEATDSVRNGVVLLRAGDDGACATLYVSQLAPGWYRTREEAIRAADDGNLDGVLLAAGRDRSKEAQYFRTIVCEQPGVKSYLTSHYAVWCGDLERDEEVLRPYLQGVTVSNNFFFCRLDRDGRICPRTERTGGMSIGKFKSLFYGGDWFVASNGADDNSGTSCEAPLRSLQLAIDKAAEGDVILVGPGTYEPIHFKKFGATIVGCEGATRTVIDGGGTNRCAYLEASSLVNGPRIALHGFTLTNGKLVGTPGDMFDAEYGAGACRGELVNCIVSNCQTTSACGYGAGVARLTADNCLICGNRATGGGDEAVGGAYDSVLRNCTVVGNLAACMSRCVGGVSGGTADNSVIIGNFSYGYMGKPYRANVDEVALRNCCTAPLEDGAQVTLDEAHPCRFVPSAGFADESGGDYHLKISSPCVAAGSEELLAVDEDLDGVARSALRHAPDIGAYAYPSERVVVRPGSGGEVFIPETWFTTGRLGERQVFDPMAFAERYGSDLEVAATQPTGKRDECGQPLFVWQDYVAGTDPVDSNDTFSVVLTWQNGLPKIGWKPQLPKDEASKRKYTLYGKDRLEDASWKQIENDALGGNRFFKMAVELRP